MIQSLIEKVKAGCSKREALLSLITLVMVVIADLASKEWVLNSFSLFESRPVIEGFFNFTFVLNTGAAFGLFSDLPEGVRQLVLAGTTFAALGVVFYFFFCEFRQDLAAKIALSAIVGGALGNAADRFRHGAVVDFIDFYYGKLHYPAFNIADSAICCAVAILLYRSWRGAPQGLGRD